MATGSSSQKKLKERSRVGGGVKVWLGGQARRGRKEWGQAVGAMPALDLHTRSWESAGLGPRYSSCCFKCFAFEL